MAAWAVHRSTSKTSLWPGGASGLEEGAAHCSWDRGTGREGLRKERGLSSSVPRGWLRRWALRGESGAHLGMGGGQRWEGARLVRTALGLFVLPYEGGRQGACRIWRILDTKEQAKLGLQPHPFLVTITTTSHNE